MKNFVFHLDTQVFFGEDALSYLVPSCTRYGKKILLCIGGGSVKEQGIFDEVMEELSKGLFDITVFEGIEPNPTITTVRRGIEQAQEREVELILALGGGSVIDAAKAIAAGVCASEDPWHFVKGICKAEEALPLGVILTLAATGSEMDNISVISNEETKEKIGWSAASALPKFALMNPRYSFSVSREMTASGIADIMSHAMENYFMVGEGSFLSEELALAILRSCVHYAPVVLQDPHNYEARANLMWAGSWAINGLLSAGKDKGWSLHPMEHELSAFYNLTHGIGLAILTCPWLDYILEEKTQDKIARFGYRVFDLEKSSSAYDDAKNTIQQLGNFYLSMGLPLHLKEVGIGSEYFELMAEKIVSSRGGYLRGTKVLGKEDLVKIYRMSL